MSICPIGTLSISIGFCLRSVSAPNEEEKELLKGFYNYPTLRWKQMQKWAPHLSIQLQWAVEKLWENQYESKIQRVSELSQPKEKNRSDWRPLVLVAFLQRCGRRIRTSWSQVAKIDIPVTAPSAS